MMLEWGVKTVSTNCRSVCEIAQAKMCNKKLGGAVELDRRCRNLPHISHRSQLAVGHTKPISNRYTVAKNQSVSPLTATVLPINSEAAQNKVYKKCIIKSGGCDFVFMSPKLNVETRFRVWRVMVSNNKALFSEGAFAG